MIEDESAADTAVTAVTTDSEEVEESPCELQRRGRGEEKGEVEGGEEGDGNVGEGVEVRQPKLPCVSIANDF